MGNIGIGFISGILSSMGLGGGSILLLYLTLILNIEHTQAAGTNLLFFLPCAILAVILYAKQKMIEWKSLYPLMLGAGIGAIIGSFAAQYIQTNFIRILFGVLLLGIGLRDLLGGIISKNPHNSAK